MCIFTIYYHEVWVLKEILNFAKAWNPASEEQCFDRCHRLGQTKDVIITKVTLSGTTSTKKMHKYVYLLFVVPIYIVTLMNILIWVIKGWGIVWNYPYFIWGAFFIGIRKWEWCKMYIEMRVNFYNGNYACIY